MIHTITICLTGKDNKIIIDSTDNLYYHMSINMARELYNDLKKLFDQNSFAPIYSEPIYSDNATGINFNSMVMERE